MSRPFYSSYNENAMLVAVIFLLLITILMLLLHFYAKWRFERRRRGIDRPGTRASPHVRDNPFPVTDDDVIGAGLDPSLVASLPVFVYKAREWKSGSGIVCVVCLSVMEEEEKGRMLPKCGHCNFHLGCIDKWLLSHSSCPICRSVVGMEEALALSVSTTVPEELVQSNLESSRGQSPADQRVDVEECGRNNMVELTDAPSSFPSSCSLKLMLSRDRFESRVHPSVQVDDVS